MVRILAWTPSLTGGIVAVRDPCLHGRFSIESLMSEGVSTLSALESNLLGDNI